MTFSTQPGDVIVASRSRARRFVRPVEVIAAHTLSETAACLRRVEAAVGRGLYAAGFITYEAAPAFNRFLETHPPGDLPLLWFGLYNSGDTILNSAIEEPHDKGAAELSIVSPELWRPGISAEQYAEAIRRIRELIAAGDTYQVNYTFPMTAAFRGDPLGWFHYLRRAQRADYTAYIDTGRFKILSISPELFFRREGRLLETRPMKGTRPRGRWIEEDRQYAAELASSEKERAENVMIVDLLRNDMGVISETGSVHAARLFDIERYETVWQMTSTITSRTDAGLFATIAALFPSGSVTGAPKIRTMQIIHELEPFPRGVYCGAIGWAAPDGRAEFNVAIRTVTVDAANNEARYNVGGGITWDSTPEAEYEECRVKAAILSNSRPDFELLESLLLEDEYFLLDEHLARLAGSAEYFGIPLDLAAARRELVGRAAALGRPPLKIRLLVARDGSYRIEGGPAPPTTPVRLGFALEPVNDRDIFLYHKTTHRAVYDRAKASRPDCDDVLLWNARGEITETRTANIVLDMGRKRLTPPVPSGLLPGTMRAHLLAEGKISEAVLTKSDVLNADEIYLINSVRKWVKARLVG